MLTDGQDTSVTTPMTPPKGVALMPTEQVLLLSIPLPGMSAAQRKAAVAFAVEDHLAATLDDVHVVLGPALPVPDAPQNWLVAVIDKVLLPAKPTARLVPDVLFLPVPQPGQWSVWADARRVLVRTADGAGFGTNHALLPYFHLAAHRPEIVLFAGELDAQFNIIARRNQPLSLDLSLQRFDLNLGRAQTAAFGIARARPFAALLAFATVAHVLLLGADVLALRRIAALQQNEVQSQITSLGMPTTGNLDADIAALLGRTTDGNRLGFLPMATTAFAAMEGSRGLVTTRDLRFAGIEKTLSLQLQAPDLATLQSVETALRASGFAVTAGAATTSDGLAEQQLTLADGGGT